MILGDIAHGKGWTVYGRDENMGRRLEAKNVGEAHYRNFVDCIRTRQRPICDIETGHISTVLVHCANIAMKTGRKLRFDATRESFVDDKQANRHLGRKYRKPWVLDDKV